MRKTQKITEVTGLSLYKKHLSMTEEEAQGLKTWLLDNDVKATQLLRRLLRRFMQENQIGV